MGYYVDYGLGIEGIEGKDPKKLRADLEEYCPDLLDSIEYCCGKDEADRFLTDTTIEAEYIGFNAKWYLRQEELENFTFKNPDLKITVTCMGEDNAQWVDYAKGGRFESYGAEINYPGTTLW